MKTAAAFLFLYPLTIALSLGSDAAAWPGDTYAGPLTAISGEIGGGTTVELISLGAYPAAGSVWKYKADFTNVSLPVFTVASETDWRTEAFDDSAWASGGSHLGYGDSPRDEATLIPRTDFAAGTTGTQSGPVALFRRKFTLQNGTEGIGSVSGQVTFDDSCALYVNGVQVYRHADLPAAALLNYYTENTPGAVTRENATANFTVPLSLLHAGENTIAAEVHQHDPASGDISFDLRLSASAPTAAEVHWTAAGGPYHLTADATVPAGRKLVIEPGTRVFAESGTRLIINGVLQALGTSLAPIRFSHRPGAALEDDPREPGTQLVAPKWDGILFQDTLSAENIVQHASFYGAQPSAVEGCITVIRSAAVADHCLFCSTYLHGVYGRNCSLTVQDCLFPDVFPPGKEALGQTLDNLSEFVEVDSPPADVAGNPAFNEGFPIGGVLRLYRNHFYGSSGHNDLVDVTAGKWGVTPVLDAQDNHFHGPTGDEHIDLNGDAYIAGNIFENCRKDAYTSDNGYANAISSDAGGADTTVVVVRNIFVGCDHAVNVKRGSAVIFEHNTVADMNADYPFVRGAFNQAVKCSAVNFFIPEDTGAAGDGAYLAYNILHGRKGGGGAPRLLSWADLDLTTRPAKTTKLEMRENFLDPALLDTAISTSRLETVISPGWQNLQANPEFTATYGLSPTSPARGAVGFGFDCGASIPAGCWIGTAPPTKTKHRDANFTIGGPGIFAFRWKLDDGPWSTPVQIMPGVFPRSGPTVRTASLPFSNLALGLRKLWVQGQDFAGNWQTGSTPLWWTITDEEPLSFVEWQGWHEISPGQDADHDGLDLETEFALGLNPLQPNPASAMPAFSGGSLHFNLPAAERQAVSYHVEYSQTLQEGSWAEVAVKSPGSAWTGPVTTAPAADPSRVDVVLDGSALPAASRVFLRLRFLIAAD